MKKNINLLLIFILLFTYSISTYADFFEDTLEFKKQEFNLQFNFYKLKDQKLNNKKYKNQYKILKKIDPKIKKLIIKKYEDKEFSYYKANGVLRHYNNFIYYTNKYFESIKLQEKFGITKETNRNIYTNFLNMKSSYYKFKNILKENY